MLKALELIGFKSFADKTRFEFPPGITVVVGPNGSGKSNIVDAIKWVLGEQSVKSLRGKDMIDVIFNGTSSRKPMNMAEVTLVFDNAERRIGVDTPEVAVTRRVYRSGEGEYLINRGACRLRDIRDLFSGTGVATEAYSVIEQGKVDVLLQASPRDRRLIFEEAAGISRFKAKKLECARRLERVDQNLLRLSDIVDEVENRLKSVRLQATKARRYQEYAERLQSLRTQVALVDWRKLSDQITTVEDEIQQLRNEIQSIGADAETLERRAIELDSRIGEIDIELHEGESRVAQNRERIASLDSIVELDRGRSHDLEELIARYRRQWLGLNSRAGDLEGTLGETKHALATAQSKHRELSLKLADEERHLTAINAQADQLRAENEQQRVAYLDQMRSSAALTNEISSLDAQLARSEERREKCLVRLAEVELQRKASGTLLAQVQIEREQLAEQSKLLQQQSATIREQLAESRREAAYLQRELNAAREQLSRTQERTHLLEEWEKNLEGVDTGVKYILKNSIENTSGPFRHVRGMLASLFQASVEVAPLIEALLAEKSQHLVYEPSEDFSNYLANTKSEWQGRVSFIPLEHSDNIAPHNTRSNSEIAYEKGVIGRADQYIDTHADYRELAQSVLQNCWIVEDLQTAWRIAGKLREMRDDAFEGNEATFVTRNGEVLSSGGTVSVGTRTNQGGGLISRKSELRALSQQTAEHEQLIASKQQQLTEVEQRVNQHEHEGGRLALEQQKLHDQLSDVRTSFGAEEQRLKQLEEQYIGLTNDARVAGEQSQAVILARTHSRNRLDQLQTSLAQAEARSQANIHRLQQLDETRQQRNRESMSMKVELARSDQQVENLEQQLRQFEQDRQERHKNLIELQEQIATSLLRKQSSEDSILVAEQQLAELFLRKESFADETASLILSKEQTRAERLAAQHESQRQRSKLRKLEERLHKRELAAEGVRHERASLEERMREDYSIELAKISDSPTEEQLQERTLVDEEINDLRRKLTNLGGVNLDSLQEVNELEGRFENLSAQFQDLSKAKNSLEQIIHKINADSRRLFAETLEQVKEHFQALFRKLFGGGRADIILEEGVDILESGIEIVARPPGKEPRNISLLSGGEKTMTCVALLLSIFRSRPSPFCVLDEVDAALDEANIERFVGVLKEFLNWTQFIVVTHSKKTMACGNTLYGVTMQESGISKRVSVRFEDVSDNGEIRINRNTSRDIESVAVDDDSDHATDAA